MAKKLKKAILAGLAAYAGAKMMGKGLKGNINAANVENANIKAALVDAADAGTKFPAKERVPDFVKMQKPKTYRSTVPKKWYEFWKKHGGSVTTAKLGKMIKAAQGTQVQSGRMLKARHGTEVRTMGSNPHVPTGGSGSIATKLNGQVKFKTF